MTVYHFDIDNTVMVNPRKSDSGENTTNSIVAQNIVGSYKLKDPTISNPLDESCIKECIQLQWSMDVFATPLCSFDEYLSRAWFSDGTKEQNVKCTLIRRLAKRTLIQIYPELKQVADRLKENYKDGEFFESFKEFVRENPSATIVWRTFGVHGERVAKKFNEECNGNCTGTDVLHRDPDTGYPTLYIGWTNTKELPDATSCPSVKGYTDIGHYMQNCEGRLILENYDNWAKSGEAANRSKLFVHSSDDCKQYFFDDNANPSTTHHLNKEKSIVDSRSTNGELIPDGKYVFRVDTVKAILENDYFLNLLRSVQ